VQVCCDILSGLIVLVGVQVIKKIYLTTRSEAYVKHVDHGMTAALVSLVVILAIFFVRNFGILWMDFLGMSLTLAFHQTTDRWMDQVWKWMVSGASFLWKLVVFKRPGEVV